MHFNYHFTCLRVYLEGNFTQCLTPRYHDLNLVLYLGEISSTSKSHCCRLHFVNAVIKSLPFRKKVTGSLTLVRYSLNDRSLAWLKRRLFAVYYAGTLFRVVSGAWPLITAVSEREENKVVVSFFSYKI